MRLILVCLLAIGNISSFAQLYRLEGTISDEQKEPLQSATVALLNPADSSLAYFGITNTMGRFSIASVKSGNYLVQASFIGFSTFYTNISVPTKDNNLGLIQMTPSAITLESAVIKAEAIPIQFKTDTVEYNAAAYKTKPNAVAEDLLKKLPGIEVDRAGNIKAMGEDVSKVLVDGKEFFSTDPKVATKNLPAESVSKVQVYDKKSDESELTGIDDSEYSKTINIMLKDNMKKAVFGDVKAGTDATNYYQGNAKVYRFTDKHQLAALGMINNINSVGFSLSDYISFNGGIRNLLSSNNGNITLSSTGNIPINLGQPTTGDITSGAGGANYSYEISKDNLLNVSYMVNGSSKAVVEDVYSNQFSQDGSFEQKSTDKGQGNNLNHMFNIGWRNKASKKQHFMVNGIATISKSNTESNNLTQTFTNELLANRLESSSKGNNYNINSTLNGSWLRRLTGKWIMVKAEGVGKISNSTSSHSWDNKVLLGSASIDQSQNLYSDGKNNQVSFLGKITTLRRLTANMFLEPSVSAGISSNLHTKEQGVLGAIKTAIDSVSPQINVNTAWATPKLVLKHNWNKSKVSLGLEYDLRQYQHTLNSGNNHKEIVSSLHPTFSWQYEIKRGHRLSANYKSQNNLPMPWQLQPIISTTNPLAIRYGNRELTHEHQQTLSLSWLLFDQFSFTSVFANASASYTRNKVGQAVSISNDFKQIIRLVNVPYDYTAQGNISFSTPIRPLKVNISINLREQANKTLSYVNSVRNDNINLTHTMKVRFDNRGKKKWDIAIGGEVSLTNSSYSIQKQLNRTYYSYSTFGDLQYTPTPAWNFRVTTDITSYHSQSFNQSVTIPLISTEVSYSFLKNRRGILSLESYDLLNRNTGISRTSGVNFLSETKANTIGRYFLLSFKYKLNGFGNDNGITINPI